ncbi:MAG TPA: hypothetical protein VH164_03640, partial [Ktedonobacteraceae bacterium]|nr:hypothetical protein [Ktedonobacteraceae bacterium]
PFGLVVDAGTLYKNLLAPNIDNLLSTCAFLCLYFTEMGYRRASGDYRKSSQVLTVSLQKDACLHK